MLFRPLRKLIVHRKLSYYSSSAEPISVAQIVDQVYSNPKKDLLFANQLPPPEPIYYFERGCRLVYPYFYVVQAYCLGAWVGRSVNEVYFKDRAKPPSQLWEQLIENGCIRVNQEKVSPDYVMQPKDVLSHVIHFHENPIIDLPFKILHEDDEFLVIDKPPGIPMHPAGRYKYNSLIGMIKLQRNPIFCFNRLDSGTSGLLVLVKSVDKVIELNNAMINKEISKEYICEVPGNFPFEEIRVDVPLTQMKQKDGLVLVDFHSGAPSQTFFKKIRYKHKTQTSLISCFPLTGRTHQIRVHLQYLGFPILNDFTYSSYAFGNKTGKHGDYGGLNDREIHSLQFEVNKSLITELHEDSVDCKDEYDDLLQVYQTPEWIEYTHENRYNPKVAIYCPECFTCKKTDREPPTRNKTFIHLHAYRYKAKDWEYKTDLPFWAR